MNIFQLKVDIIYFLHKLRKPSTLKKFINFKQTENEKKFRLEQLRALDNGIPIDVVYTQNSPIGVDTMDDFMEIKKIMEYKKD